MARTLDYSVLDVFAESALEGNALAVFHDARGLSDNEMQALARETNLSESTFVIPADDESAGTRVRIFTVEEELPFAGHPTLGTASWLHLNRKTLGDTIRLLLNSGPIDVIFESEAGAGIVGRMRQKDPVFGEVWDPAEIAPVIGMSAADLLPGYAPQTVSTGNPFCIVPLKDAETLARLAIPQAIANPWLKARGIRWFYCVAPLANGNFRARMQWLMGEDPATGSAAGPCIAWLVRNGLAASGREVIIEQGAAVHRPSVILASASLSGERVHSVDIGGRTIPVAQGRYFLP